jgi:hypothetical protein
MKTSTGGPALATEPHHAHPAVDDTNLDGRQSDHHSGHGGHQGGAHTAARHAGHHTEAFRRRFWGCVWHLPHPSERLSDRRRAR